jgi:hypothetical protein
VAAIITIVVAIVDFLLIKAKYNPLLIKAHRIEQKIEEQEKNGIKNLYFMYDEPSRSERNETIIEAIRNSSELYLVAEAGLSYLGITVDRFWRHIEDKLHNNIPFKILLLDPNCENKTVRNNLNNVKEIGDKMTDIKTLLYIKNRYRSVEIRFTNQIYCSIFYTDNYMIYDPYILGKIGNRIENDFIAIELKERHRNYNILKSHFQNLWNSAIPIDDILK